MVTRVIVPWCEVLDRRVGLGVGRRRLIMVENKTSCRIRLRYEPDQVWLCFRFISCSARSFPLRSYKCWGVWRASKG